MDSNSGDQGGSTRRYLDQAAINHTPSQLGSSYAGSMSGIIRGRLPRDDDEQSKVSTHTSYPQETGEERLVRREMGRDFNMLSDTYSIPTDADEWDRLDKQHRAMTLGLGALYPAPEVVRALLAPEDGVTKKIVDLGCGTGIWSTEMAREFPHCDVLGIDLAPVPLPPASFPPNCRFEMDDINLGLPHLQGQFDVVFARAIALGLKDFRKALADVQGCAKPGGIVIWLDGDFDLYFGWPMVYRPFWSRTHPEGSYAQRVIYEVRRSACRGGADLKTMEKVIDEGFWRNGTLLDPDTCKTASLYLPVGTWCEGDDRAQTELVRYVGMLMRQDISEIATSTQPLLLKTGWSKETTDRWAAGMKEECQSSTLGIRVRLAWGRRRQSADLPAPALNVTGGGQAATKYPLYEVYDTPEQASMAAAVRNQGKDIPEPPLASQSTE